MAREVRLSRRAARSLSSIAVWTRQTFGDRQAHAYRDELIAACRSLAEGAALSRSCRELFAPDIAEDLRFMRCGMHFIVFVQTADAVSIADFVHARADLPARLAALGGKERD
ncbi:type II toxin-antitoxin system RelE/ParE family toxin [Glycocaulis profundi]|nr:type II toxin-antitoxin system RelE/ParE family toxin [Glycocaulis profundi]